MTEKTKKLWLHLYEVAQQIAAMDPWEDFTEEDCFSFIWKDKRQTVFFSFIGETAGKCGIACYLGEDDYIRARVRLSGKNEKYEPIFLLQNALVCLWDNRDELSKDSYSLIKELGFKFRGKGAWLHFDRYKIGYAPVTLEPKEVNLFATALENLHMMLRAIYENGLDPQFDKKNTLVRWYEPKDKLYYTHPFEINLPKDIISHPIVTVQENDHLHEMQAIKTSDYSVEIDWSYVGIVLNDDAGRKTIPRLLLALERKNSIILFNEMLAPSQNTPNSIFVLLDYLVDRYGKPSEIVVCDEDLRGILADVCKKVGIKLTMKKRLSATMKARRSLLADLL